MKKCWRIINKKYVAFFPYIEEGKQKAVELRNTDKRMKRSRIDEVLQGREEYINGEIYERDCELYKERMRKGYKDKRYYMCIVCGQTYPDPLHISACVACGGTTFVEVIATGEIMGKLS